MSVDRWAEFQERAARHELCGYFEWRDADRPAENRSISYFDPEQLISIRRAEDLRAWARVAAGTPGRDPHHALLGYFGFDAVSLFDPLYARPPDGSPFPLGEFAVLKHARVRSTATPRPARRGVERLVPAPKADSLPKRAFAHGVSAIQNAIRAGDAYQIVLAHRRRYSRPGDLLARAGVLRRRERYAAFYYLRFAGREIVGATPETVIERTRTTAYISPIAGTRPLRGRAARRLPLRGDPKELAEHRMLVDLARNDLGRLAVPASVRLVYVERPERFARLEHMVSRVAATPLAGTTPLGLLQAAFPAGTVCGAPKIRATATLRAVESTWRGPYGGAVGVVHGDGTSFWALAIRSAFVVGSDLYTAAGAGVVIGSRPTQEWEETLVKLSEVESTLLGGSER